MAKRVIVVGAGASGLMAAIAAARSGAAVTVLDGMKKAGSKLLLTGNGRCNLTNLSEALPAAYLSQGASREETEHFARGALSVLPVSRTLDLFREMGVQVREKEGYVYPRSGQASTVLGALLAELEWLRVKMKYNARVTGLSRDAATGVWSVSTQDWTYEADRVILCCGSNTLPQTGSDGGGFALAASLGHEVTPLSPCLTALVCGERDIGLCAGARTWSRVSLVSHREERGGAASGRTGRRGPACWEETGEVQWTEQGISGIVVFQVSRGLPAVFSPGELEAVVDLVPDLTEEEVGACIAAMRAHHPAMRRRQLLESFTHERVAAYLERRCGKAWDRTEEQRVPQTPDGRKGAADPLAAAMAAALKEVRLSVTGRRGFERCQVTRGGVALREVCARTLESLLCPGLYFAGELLDVDGPCGGYNLQWAWSSGYLAGAAAAGEEGGFLAVFLDNKRRNRI